MHRIGDINADGFDDFAVQAWKETGFGWSIGVLFLYMGGPSGMGSYPDATAWNPASGSWIGDNSVVNIGDITGDGINDFAANFMTENNIEHGFVIFAGRGWQRTGLDDVPLPATSTILAYPNPFTRAATITAADKAQIPSTVMVYDGFGREIRRLMVSPSSGGDAHILWDGRDERASMVPAGIYYFLLETKTGLLKGKIVRQE